MKLNELEYKALNIMDEIVTVEVAFDPVTRTIHVYDCNQAVEPEYNFARKNFEVSDGFHQMTAVLATKGFITYEQQELAQWVQTITWRFYSSKATIKTLSVGEMTVEPVATLLERDEATWQQQNYYPRYVQKLLAAIK